MSKNILTVLGLATVIVAFQNCSNPNFAGSASTSLSKLDSGSDASGMIPANGTLEDGFSEIEAEDCDDEKAARIPVSEFLMVVAADPAEAARISKEQDCYISHGGGHGIELCVAGDKAALSPLWPIEIKGDQVCVPVNTLVSNAALFAGSTIGRCGKN